MDFIGCQQTDADANSKASDYSLSQCTPKSQQRLVSMFNPVLGCDFEIFSEQLWFMKACSNRSDDFIFF